MNRQEYIELVNDWNNFILKEEKKFLNERLLVESIILNENKLKKLASKAGISSIAMLIALASSVSGATPKEVINDTDRVGAHLSPVIVKAIEGIKNASDNLERETESAEGYLTSAGPNKIKAQVSKITGSHNPPETSNIIRVGQEESTRRDLKKIGKKLKDLAKAGNGFLGIGKKIITYSSYYHRDLFNQYKSYLELDEEDIDKIIDKSNFLKKAFGSSLAGDFDGSQFDRKIKLLRKQKNTVHFKRLATVSTVFIECAKAIGKCKSKLKELKKKVNVSAKGKSIGGTVGFEDDTDAHFSEDDFIITIWGEALRGFEKDVGNLLNRIYNPEVDSDEFSDMEKAVLSGFITHKGKVYIARIETWAEGMRVERGERETKVSSDLRSGRQSKLQTQNGELTGGIDPEELEDFPTDQDEELERENKK